MAPKKSANDQASDVKSQAEWDQLIANGLDAVDQKDGYHKMETLYEMWRTAQAEELRIWGKSNKKSVWKYSQTKPSEYKEKLKEKLKDTGKGYIPVSQFDDWGHAFLNDSNLRETMLKTCIRSYIVPDQEKAQTFEEETKEQSIWDAYHDQDRRILIISREAALYGSTPLPQLEEADGMAKDQIGKLCWALDEAYSSQSLALEDGETIEQLITDQIDSLNKDIKKLEKYLSGAKKDIKNGTWQSSSLDNAWLRKVARDDRDTGEPAARNVLLAAYLMKAEEGEERADRALEVLKELYPALKDHDPDSVSDARSIIKDHGLDQSAASKAERKKWAGSLDNVAYLTVNKRGGASSQGKSKGKDVFNGYIERYGDLLLKEISLYDPTEIVVYGKEVYEWLAESNLKKAWEQELTRQKKAGHPVKVYGFHHWAERPRAGQKGADAISSYAYKINQFTNPDDAYKIDLKN